MVENIRHKYANTHSNAAYLRQIGGSYYPFGMTMPHRQFTGNQEYRFGFNGKETDSETDLQDYGFRIYNPALGKFLSVDPLTKDYPSWSPYPFAMNRPIDGVDLDGKEWERSNVTYDIFTNQFTVTYKVKVAVFDQTKIGLNTNEINDIAHGIGNQVQETYSGFDEIRKINYKTEFEYKIIDLKSIESGDYSIPNGFTMNLGETTSEILPDGMKTFVAGRTPNVQGGSQINSFKINCVVDCEIRETEDICRTGTHELGHTVGLEHPWEITNGQQDINQNEPSNSSKIKTNILNSGANPNEDLRYIQGDDNKALEATPDQLKKISEKIPKDKLIVKPKE